MKSNLLIILFCFIFFILSSVHGQTTVNINPNIKGRTFEGIGALSAGASSRLLIDYPEPIRSQILDLLFKPRFGASLHHLKIEIGGDVNSTDGSEPSVAHTKNEFLDPKPEYFNRGYEFWLMKEAVKRNPNIYLDALQWGAPAWIGNGNFFSQDNVDFLIQFIEWTKKVHGLDINYAGVWNERYFMQDYPQNKDWVRLFKQELKKHNLKTEIVAYDETKEFKVLDELILDSTFNAAVDILGSHYIYQKPDIFNIEKMDKWGKRVWASEDGPWRGDWAGAKDLVKRFNNNYIKFQMTKTIIWSLISSYYDNLPLPSSGPIKANKPWSGTYTVEPALWAFAHYTQFTAPGWFYLKEGCGFTTDKSSSYTSLVSPNGNDLSIIIETADSKTSQTVTFELGENFTRKDFYVWKSDSLRQFYQLKSIKPKNRKLSFTFDKACIYTLSTTKGQQKGDEKLQIPQSKPFPLPYTDDFESYGTDQLPKYTQDQAGAFEVQFMGENKVLKQMAPSKGIEWLFHLNPEPYTFLGDTLLSDYEVSIDVMINGGYKSASVYGRIHKVSQYTMEPPQSYWLKVDANGVWKLGKTEELLLRGRIDLSTKWPLAKLNFSDHTKNAIILSYNELQELDKSVLESLTNVRKLLETDSNPQTLKMIITFNGNFCLYRENILKKGITAIDLNKWTNLKLAFKGSRIVAYIANSQLCEIIDHKYSYGYAGFGCGWHEAWFDNLKIEKK